MKKIIAALVILAVSTALVFAAGGQQQPAAGPAKITVEVFDRGTDGGRSQVDNNNWTRWIQEKVLKDLNIEVRFHPVGRWTEEADLIALMASGNAPDLCYTYNNSNVGNFRDQGGLFNIAPHVDRLLPDMKKLLGSDPAITGKNFIMRDQMPDGRMFSIPSYRVALAIRNTFIRKDWLDKLGLPLPTTLPQFYSALVAFRDRDPGNVGRANIIPIMTDEDVRWNLAEFILSYVTPNISDKDRYIYGFGGGAARSLALPNIKEGVREMNKWYNEGLIFHDFPLVRQGADDYWNNLKNGFAGAFSGNWDLPYRVDYNINTELKTNIPGAEFVPLFLNLNNMDIYDKVGLRMLVPASSKNPEAALRYLNWLTIPENYQYLQRGNEGVNHRMVNGVPQIIATAPNDPWIQNSGQNIDFTMPMNGVEMGSEEMNARVIALTYGTTPPDTIVNAYQFSVRGGRAPVVNTTPTKQDGVYGQTLQDKANALLSQAITASPANFDNIWNAGYRDWLQSGGQAVMDERIKIANDTWK